MNGLGTSQPDPVMRHHQKAALCAPPGAPSGRTAISWPRALHPGGCPLARGILILPVVISYAYVGFMAISFPLLACLVLVGQGSPTDMGECFEGRAGHNPGCIVRPALGSWSCSACVRDAPGTPGTFHIAAHQSNPVTPGPWCRDGVGLRFKPGFGQKRRMLCNREFCRCLGFPLKVDYGLFNQRLVAALDDCLQRFVKPCW